MTQEIIKYIPVVYNPTIPCERCSDIPSSHVTLLTKKMWLSENCREEYYNDIKKTTVNLYNPNDI